MTGPRLRSISGDRRAHGFRVRHIRAHVAGTHSGGGEARKIVREFLVRLRIAPPDERELHAGFAGKRQRALRRDALAAAGDEQNVFRADGNFRFDLRRRKLRKLQPRLKSPTVAREMNFRESVRRERFRDDPFDRLRMRRGNVHDTRCHVGIFQMQRPRKTAAAPAVLNHDESRRLFQRQRRATGVEQQMKCFPRPDFPADKPPHRSSSFVRTLRAAVQRSG